MLTSKEITNLIEKNLKEKYIENNKFKNLLKNFDLDFPIRKIDNMEYSYGYKENLGEFFILIREDLEGFMLWSTAFKENGNYVFKKLIVTTKDFIELKKIYENIYNLEILRKELITKYYEDKAKIKTTRNNLFANIYFNGARKKRQTKVKVIGLVLLNELLKEENVYPIERIKNSIIIEYREINRTNRRFHNNFFNLTEPELVSVIIYNDIDYIIKNKIDIESIAFALREKAK